MTVWITKHALTRGIEKAEAEICGDVRINMIAVHGNLNNVHYYHGQGIEWHKTESGAVKKAAEMVGKKISSYRKGIEKMQSLEQALILRFCELRKKGE